MAETNTNSERYSLADVLPDDPPENVRVFEIGGSIVVIVLLLCAFAYALSYSLPTGDAEPAEGEAATATE